MTLRFTALAALAAVANGLKMDDTTDLSVVLSVSAEELSTIPDPALRTRFVAALNQTSQLRAALRASSMLGSNTSDEPVSRHRKQGLTCDLSKFDLSVQDVDRVCCSADKNAQSGHRLLQAADDPCSHIPDTCDHECAAVFEPFFDSCREHLAVSLSPALMDSLGFLRSKCGGSFGGPAAVTPAAAAEQFASVEAAAVEEPGATSMVSVASQISFAADIETIAEATPARAEFEAGFKLSMAGALGDGATVRQDEVHIDEIRAMAGAMFGAPPPPLQPLAPLPPAVGVNFHVTVPDGLQTTTASLMETLKTSRQRLEVTVQGATVVAETASLVQPIWISIGDQCDFTPPEPELRLVDFGDLQGCFDAPVTATQVPAEVIVFDPDAPCGDGRSWIHNADGNASPMTAGAGPPTHTYQAMSCAPADVRSYAPEVGSCFATPACGSVVASWHVSRDGSCEGMIPEGDCKEGAEVGMAPNGRITCTHRSDGTRNWPDGRDCNVPGPAPAPAHDLAGFDSISAGNGWVPLHRFAAVSWSGWYLARDADRAMYICMLNGYAGGEPGSYCETGCSGTAGESRWRMEWRQNMGDSNLEVDHKIGWSSQLVDGYDVCPWGPGTHCPSGRQCEAFENGDESNAYRYSQKKVEYVCFPKTKDATGACASSPCLNGGACTDHGDLYACDCDWGAGFYGDNCEQREQPCDPNPCQNGGICLEAGALDPITYVRTDYACRCPEYWDRPSDTPKQGNCATRDCCSSANWRPCSPGHCATLSADDYCPNCYGACDPSC